MLQDWIPKVIVGGVMIIAGGPEFLLNYHKLPIGSDLGFSRSGL